MIKRLSILALSIAALALPSFAQQKEQQPPAAEGKKPVAVINGEVLTAEQLDMMWNNLGTAIRDQYDQAGGKPAFLTNYVGKRLILQEAIKKGFDKRPDVRADMDAARESALFDRYVRDVVAAPFLPESEIKKYYDEHQADFAVPEKLKIRQIVITASNAGPAQRTKEQALERIKQVMAEVQSDLLPIRRSSTPEAALRYTVIRFADAARKYSEDASAASGGDLGWVSKGQLDPDFENEAWHLPVGTMSGIVETKFGYHLILVEEKKPAGTEPYAEARPKLREFLLSQRATEIMAAVNKLTNDLRNTSKVTLFPENVH